MRTLSSRLLSGIILLCFPVLAQSQTDTEFWFAAPEVSQGVTGVPVVSNQNMDRPIVIRVTAYSQPATVTISQPAGTGAGYMPPQVINIPAGGTQSVDITSWLDSIETKPANQVLNYGIKISSTAPVSAYYEVVSTQCQCNPEIWVLKGRNALGTDFLIPSQNLVDNGYHPGTVGNHQILNPAPYSSFDIVVTEDNTTVTITPAQNIVGHTAGSTFSITLNAGQTWSATASSHLAAGHLNGSRVTSDKPIAVTYKDDLIRDGSQTLFSGGCGDLGGDQLVPVRILGTEYIAMKGQLNGIGDQVFVMATQNNTQIFRDGNAVPVATLNAGDTYRMPVAATVGQIFTYIRASAPVSVLQMTGFGCEIGQAILPAIKCTGSSSVSFVRSTAQQLTVNLLVAAGGQNDFLINGAPLTATFTAVPGTSNQWYAAIVTLPVGTYPQNSVVNVFNTSALFHLGMVDGTGGTGARFGYFSNYAVVEAEATAASNEVCSGDTIRLFANQIAGATYSWTGPGGFSSNERNPFIHNAGGGNSGVYTLTVDMGDCGSATDTLALSVFALPAIDLGQDTSLCADALVLKSRTSIPGATYRWNTGAISDSLTVTGSGSYSVTVTNTSGCKNSDTIIVELHDLLEVDLGNDTSLCDRDMPLELSSAQLSGASYVWNTGSTHHQIMVLYGGTYWLEVKKDGCTGSDTMDVHVVRTPEIFAGPDTTICISQPLRIGAYITGASYSWNTGGTDPYIEVSATGTYVLTVNLEGCIVSDTVHITAMPDPDVDLGGDRDICPEETIILDATCSGNNAYLWNTGDTTPVLNVATAGLYAVSVTSEFSCTGNDSVLLTFYPLPVVTLGADTTVCEETPLLLAPRSLHADSLIWSDGRVAVTLPVRYGGTYVATGINKCGSASDTIVVQQIFCDIWLPNVFTPNGDGLNDVFRILGNMGRMEAVSFSIFNRWGERIFHTADKMKGWDGTYKGREAMLGTYVYMLQYSIGGVPYLQKGNFHLIR